VVSFIKLLDALLIHNDTETGTLSLGDAGELSPNASVMLRIATLSAWAELAIASAVQGYLKDLIKPYRSSLASLWVASLRDYASVRADTEVLQEDTPATWDVSYTNLGKEVLLPVRLQSVMSFTRSLFLLVLPNRLAGNPGSHCYRNARWRPLRARRYGR
jgi:hypothetical protein